MKRPEDSDGVTGALVAEADARRARLAGNLDELSTRMRPSNLVEEAKQRALARLDALTDEWVSIGADLVTDLADWLRGHRGLAAGGTATALLGAGLVWYLTRRTPVPLYAAYDMEDPLMTESEDANGGLGRKANDAWSKVKEDARELGKSEAKRS